MKRVILCNRGTVSKLLSSKLQALIEKSPLILNHRGRCQYPCTLYASVGDNLLTIALGENDSIRLTSVIDLAETSISQMEQIKDDRWYMINIDLRDNKNYSIDVVVRMYEDGSYASFGDFSGKYTFTSSSLHKIKSNVRNLSRHIDQADRDAQGARDNYLQGESQRNAAKSKRRKKLGIDVSNPQSYSFDALFRGLSTDTGSEDKDYYEALDNSVAEALSEVTQASNLVWPNAEFDTQTNGHRNNWMDELWFTFPDGQEYEFVLDVEEASSCFDDGGAMSIAKHIWEMFLSNNELVQRIGQ